MTAESGPSVIAGFLCTLCQEDEGPCTCREPCGSVLCRQFPGTCGTYPNGVSFHCWLPLPALTSEQILHWKVEHPDVKCMCGERSFPQ